MSTLLPRKPNIILFIVQLFNKVPAEISEINNNNKVKYYTVFGNS